MATNVYMDGRKKYQRPQAMLWSENPGVISSGIYIPYGMEIGQDGQLDDTTPNGSFLILSDDNRQPLKFDSQRIEKRERMINGRMRSYHIADKLTLSTSWNLLPSRAFSSLPEFSGTTGKSPLSHSGYTDADTSYTSDGGAGGVEMLDWYKNHTGSFWVFLAYDKNSNFAGDDNQYDKLPQYNEIIEMFIADFSYSVERRGGSNHDLWNITVTLEEV